MMKIKVYTELSDTWQVLLDSSLRPSAINTDKYQLIEFYGPVELDMFV